MNKQQYIRAWEHIKDHEMNEEIRGKSYREVAQMVQDGCFDVYYNQARKTLKYIYNETDEQANKYTDNQVWAQYKHVIALTSQHPKYN